MKLTDEQATALRIIMQRQHTRAVAQLLKVTNGTVSRWKNGHIGNIKAENFDRLVAFIEANGGPRGSGHPCDALPEWLRDLCRAWPRVSVDDREMVEAVARKAVAHAFPAEDHPVPAAKAVSGA